KRSHGRRPGADRDPRRGVGTGVPVADAAARVPVPRRARRPRLPLVDPRGRGRTLPRGGWLAAGVLAGAWATFLGGGYVSNLVFTAAFLAAAAALARRTRRAAF